MRAWSSAILGRVGRDSASTDIVRHRLTDTGARDGRIPFAFRVERPLSLIGPQASRLLALIALELVGHPEHRAVDHGAVIAGQVHDARLDDEAAVCGRPPRCKGFVGVSDVFSRRRPCVRPT